MRNVVGVRVGGMGMGEGKQVCGCLVVEVWEQRKRSRRMEECLGYRSELDLQLR